MAYSIGTTVSRRLRKAGFNISPAAARHKRDGVFVKAMGDRISVLIDLGNGVENHAVATSIWMEASAWTQTSNFDSDGNGRRILVWFTYRPEK